MSENQSTLSDAHGGMQAGTERTSWGMPTNQLRYQAEELLRLARKAHDKGRLNDARALTLQAAGRLEDAVSLEELRRKHPMKAQNQVYSGKGRSDSKAVGGTQPTALPSSPIWVVETDGG